MRAKCDEATATAPSPSHRWRYRRTRDFIIGIAAIIMDFIISIDQRAARGEIVRGSVVQPPNTSRCIGSTFHVYKALSNYCLNFSVIILNNGVSLLADSK